MNVTLYTNLSPINKINKALTSLNSYPITLRAECDVLNPTIQITAEISFNANYMYIDNFGRYYFITDIKSIRNGVYEVTGRVDVLQTYASAILGNTAVIARQQNKYNVYLNDTDFVIEQKPKTQTRTFPSGFNDEPNIILVLAGG